MVGRNWETPVQGERADESELISELRFWSTWPFTIEIVCCDIASPDTRGRHAAGGLWSTLASGQPVPRKALTRTCCKDLSYQVCCGDTLRSLTFLIPDNLTCLRKGYTGDVMRLWVCLLPATSTCQLLLQCDMCLCRQQSLWYRPRGHRIGSCAGWESQAWWHRERPQPPHPPTWLRAPSGTYPSIVVTEIFTTTPPLLLREDWRAFVLGDLLVCVHSHHQPATHGFRLNNSFKALIQSSADNSGLYTLSDHYYSVVQCSTTHKFIVISFQAGPTCLREFAWPKWTMS